MPHPTNKAEFKETSNEGAKLRSQAELIEDYRLWADCNFVYAPKPEWRIAESEDTVAA